MQQNGNWASPGLSKLEAGETPRMEQGTLLAIATRTGTRVPMMESATAEITTEEGVRGDFRGRPGPRQVTVMAIEDWQAACDELAEEIPWTARRANLLVSGLKLDQTSGRLVTIGDVTLEVTGETEPCYRMDEVRDGLQNALGPNWRAGVSCRVVVGGHVEVGSGVTLQEKEDEG